VIAYLRGKVLAQRPGRLVVDVGGVGYEVFAPVPTTLALKPDDDVSLHVHTLVREDALQLFGFADADELALFELVTGVTGVGPRLALALISEVPLPELVRAIREANVARLTRVTGIGRKTADRLCLELKDKVVGLAPAAAAKAAEAGAAEAAPASAGPLDDAVSALVNLGYSRARAEAAVRSAAADGDGASLEDLVRRGLASLARTP
jgi:Holliday junction DNA helicase RuvA